MTDTEIDIRSTNRADLENISGLYSYKKSIDELEWLLRDNEKSSYRSFVAVDPEKGIVGHIGYTVSTYVFGNKRLSGVYPFLWIVAPDCRGGVGIRLLNRVNNLADIDIVIGGSDVSQILLPHLKYVRKFDIPVYRKVLKPLEYFGSLKTGAANKTALLTLHAMHSLKRLGHAGITSSVCLEQFEDTAANITDHVSACRNTPDGNYLAWLAACPLHDASIFTIVQDNERCGIAVCYISKDGRAGRIVFLSHLGDHPETWRGAMIAIENFFRTKGCTHIDILVSYGLLHSSLTDLEYSPVSGHTRPFFLRDIRGLLADVPDDSWHWTFGEGDIGYRF